MNDLGVAGCRAHLDEIVDDMMPRLRRWWREQNLNVGDVRMGRSFRDLENE